MIACLPDEPRFIGDQDVFALQEKVIERILTTDRDAEARAAAPTLADPIQQTVAEELKDAIRRGTGDRDAAKAGIRFLGQPMGRSLHARLKAAYEGWSKSKDDKALVAVVTGLADQFAKDRTGPPNGQRLRREELELICFEYVSG
jgi:hypothetical protein